MKESTRRKLAHAGGKIPTPCNIDRYVTRRFLREVFEARGGYGVSVIRFLEIPNFGKFRIDPRYKDHRGKPVVSDPGEHGCRRARGLERPAGSRARRARVQPRRRGLDRRGQAALAPAHVQRRCVGAFPEVFNTRIRGTDTSHAARGMACPVGDGATRCGARRGTIPRRARSNVEATSRTSRAFSDLSRSPLIPLSSRTAATGGVFKNAAVRVLRHERRLMSTGEVTKYVRDERPILSPRNPRWLVARPLHAPEPAPRLARARASRPRASPPRAFCRTRVRSVPSDVTQVSATRRAAGERARRARRSRLAAALARDVSARSRATARRRRGIRARLAARAAPAPPSTVRFPSRPSTR